MDLIWLIPILPGIGAAINGLVGIRAFRKNVSGLLACATMIGALGLSIYAFVELLRLALLATKLPPSRIRAQVVPSAAGSAGSASVVRLLPGAYSLFARVRAGKLA